MSEPNQTILRARRKLQRLFPKGVSPALSIYIGNAWEEALEKDPQGSQVVRLVDDLEERLTPMKG